LGFLGASPFGGENPSFWGLEKVGFPWILSSESRLINGLRGIFRKIFFMTPGSPEKPERALKVEATRKGGIVHGASLTRFLIVSKQLSSEPAERAKLLILALAVCVHLHERPHE
jgi:hypothetical protein